MSGLRVRAFAKVNLSLEILGKRPDGFHEIRSVMQSISLADELTIESAPGLSLSCDVAHLAGDDNLVIRAARLLQKAAGRQLGASISLRKGIPEAAGLGGASSDGASALVGLSHLWGLDLCPDQLCGLAAELGSDVPFFLTGGTALIEGRGEIVSPLLSATTAWLVLLVPAHTVMNKTAALYRLLGPTSWSSGESTEKLAGSISHGNELQDSLLRNSFEVVADVAFPGLAACRQAMHRAGAEVAHLSGAGPTIYALLRDESSAKGMVARLETEGHRPILAHTMGAGESGPRPIATRE